MTEDEISLINVHSWDLKSPAFQAATSSTLGGCCISGEADQRGDRWLMKPKWRETVTTGLECGGSASSVGL
jgi:hypothetical protein